jgi:hypothetical protein
MTNRDLLKEAIADAKAIKETAIANAKAALEESFTPHLMSRLAAKINEMDDVYEEDDTLEEVNDELEEMKDEEKVEEAKEEMEEIDLDELLAELDEETVTEAKEEEETEETEEEIDLENMSEEDLKNFIEGVIEDMIADGEIEAGHEGIEDEAGAEDEGEELDEDFNIDEILAELKGDENPVEEASRQGVYDNFNEWKKSFPEGTKFESENNYMVAKSQDNKELGKWNPIQMMGMHADDSQYNTLEEKEMMKSELKEAYAAIKTLRTELNEINVLNAKLLYTNKIFKAKNLTESEKVKVLTAFDKATSKKEAQLVYETLVEGLKNKPKSPIKENLGRASKPAGMAIKKPILESNDMVARFQKLAGII